MRSGSIPIENNHMLPENRYAYAPMSVKTFQSLSLYIYQNFGIKLPPTKLKMVESRLQKRLRVLQMNSFSHYLDFVFSQEGQQEEHIHMIDLITTNKTDFFREPAHFEFLSSVYLPEFEHDFSRTRLKIWSAGCSSGEEPYTLAMVLSEYNENHTPVDFNILGSDLSSEMLKRATNAVYAEEKIQIIPLYLRKKYLLRAKDTARKVVRITPKLRAKVSFFHQNLMSSVYQAPKDLHIIFCRNVLIYFDRPTQEKVIINLCQYLREGGYLFLGHSESITDLKVPLKQVRPTIYRKW